MNFKTWFAVSISAVCIIAGYSVYKIGAKSGVQRYASNTLALETKEITEKNEALEEQKEKHTEAIEEANTTFSENERENKELDGYYTQIKEYETKIADLDKELTAAKSKKESVAVYNSGLADISNQSTGETEKLEEGIHLCPDTIKTGRYKLTGTGMFRVVDNTSNNVTDSQNLKNLDGNSYTLNLTENSKLITEGEVSITPVK